jgi:hypothetical protein
MEILEAFDLTRCAHSAAQLVGCDHKTVARYVALRDAGADLTAQPRRSREIDPFLAKVEELVDRSAGKIRADVVHQRLRAMGYQGSPRSTRRAVAELKAAWRAGPGRRYRPWVPEPGMWLQFDWGDGPMIGHFAGVGASKDLGHRHIHKPHTYSKWEACRHCRANDRPGPCFGSGLVRRSSEQVVMSC